MSDSAANGRKVLVIVESPAKAKTIAGYLGEGYTVEASVGHIRDLLGKASELPENVRKQPWAKYCVDTEHGYTGFYAVHPSKKAKVAELKKALAGVDELYLATDEDREGEAIAWHLLEVLKPKVPVKRMVFNEITKDAIRAAAANTRQIDMKLVDAQETRRIVDRLYGYPVSEVLWRKIGSSARSAGRVQSVAVRLVVDRERERIAFVSASYWGIDATFNPESFSSRLLSVDGARIATGKDFDQAGELTSKGVVVVDEAAARALAAGLEGAEFTVASVEEKPGTRRPSAPFMTSTLQQEASKRFRWGAQRTMRCAQGLYERGYITYMRTDSTSLSEQAITAARRQAAELYGPEYVPASPRTYANKVKNAQEAHEAIRPSGDVFRTPAEVAGELSGDDYALYDLIWKRTVSSQMADAKVSTTSVRIDAPVADGRKVQFAASGTVVLFAGWLAALEESFDENEDREDARRLPKLVVGQKVDPLSLVPNGHSTNPPSRYTESSLIKRLEELGIGRPSTYASIMSTIVDRGYVSKRGQALVPSFTALAVVRLLEQHFGELVDYSFTASMEDILDLISTGQATRVAELETFWRGGRTETGNEFPGVLNLTSDLESIDARAIATFPIKGTEAVLRVGKYGSYIERGEERADVPVSLAPDELDAEKAEELLRTPSGGRVLGTDPVTGRDIVAKSGRFGPYVTEIIPEDEASVPVLGKNGKPLKKATKVKARTGSLLSTMSLETITLDEALKLLTLPRVVGTDPESGEEIVAHNGRYGPYLAKGTDSRSLTGESELFTVTLEQAQALFAAPKQRRGRGQAAGPLREVGNDPISGALIVVRDGRFGPYVTDGIVNATLRTSDDPMTVSIERASDLIAEKRAKDIENGLEPGGKRPAAKRTAAKRPAAKKPATLTKRTVKAKAK